jgi:hypothetical protein
MHRKSTSEKGPHEGVARSKPIALASVADALRVMESLTQTASSLGIKLEFTASGKLVTADGVTFDYRTKDCPCTSCTSCSGCQGTCQGGEKAS